MVEYPVPLTRRSLAVGSSHLQNKMICAKYAPVTCPRKFATIVVYADRPNASALSYRQAARWRLRLTRIVFCTLLGIQQSFRASTFRVCSSCVHRPGHRGFPSGVKLSSKRGSGDIRLTELLSRASRTRPCPMARTRRRPVRTRWLVLRGASRGLV